MALQSKIIVAVYVRHKATCPKAKHGEFYHACECPKWLRYSFNGRQHRVSAETRSWGVAEEKANEKQQQLDAGTDTALQHSSEKPNLKRAIEIFIASKRNQELSDAVIGKYERELDRLEQFMSMRSRFFPADIRLEDLEEFRVDWKRVYESSLTRQKVQERLRSFLRYCYEAGWITRVPKLSAIKVDEPPTLPLTDIEYTKLLSQCATKFIPDKAKKVHALVRVMRHSGLAIRDAVTIERNEIIWDKKKAVHRHPSPSGHPNAPFQTSPIQVIHGVAIENNCSGIRPSQSDLPQGEARRVLPRMRMPQMAPIQLQWQATSRLCRNEELGRS